jgi:hypothetical protein
MLGDLILVKMKRLENIKDIYSAANMRLGESAYLVHLEINSPLDLAIFGPIKSIYFLASPLPMNWRGFMDVFAFFSDSLMYLGVIIYYLMNRSKFEDKRALILSLIVSIIGAVFIFGIGVSNTGTAVRHRQKLIPLFIVLLATMMDERQRYLNKRKLRKQLN